MMMTKCVECGGSTFTESRTEDAIEVGGRRFAVEVEVEACASCGAVYYPGPALGRAEVRQAALVADSGVSTGDAFRLMRKSIGLAARDLAALLDVQPETVSRWETGKRDPERAAMTTLKAIVAEFAQGSADTLRRLVSVRSGGVDGLDTVRDVMARAVEQRTRAAVDDDVAVAQGEVEGVSGWVVRVAGETVTAPSSRAVAESTASKLRRAVARAIQAHDARKAG